MAAKVALLGATGFVGAAVAKVLAEEVHLVRVTAPRLTTAARTLGEVGAEAAQCEALGALTAQLRGVDVVINCAGDPDASSLAEDALFGANALLPTVVLRAARDSGVKRVVHVSSAVVQNDRSCLDSTEELRPFSPYSASKCLGEEAMREPVDGVEVVRYRPPSVHSVGRRVTRMVRRIACSPMATVASPGDQPSPQALLPNVASAIAFLARHASAPPPVVHHPWEGVTVSSLMSDLSGGRQPRRIPRLAAATMVAIGKKVGRVHRPTAANARRVELLWLGQGQAESWLSSSGWVPPVGREGWRALSTNEDVL